jgi:ABC-2 type transport system ATP-binding protein
MGKILIEVKNLVKEYPGTLAVKNASFRVSEKSVHGFLGPNGAGKTTSLKMICGLLHATKGELFFAGQSYSSDSSYINQIKTQIGYLPETPPIYDDLSVLDCLKFCGQLRNLNKMQLKNSIERVNEMLNLSDLLPRRAGHLSKGQKQKLGLAQALLHQPKLIVLDEPTAGLDPLAIREMRRLIAILKTEHTVILSSHLLHEVELCCDEITIIEKGQTIISGPLNQVMATKKIAGENSLKTEVIFLTFFGNEQIVEKIFQEHPEVIDWTFIARTIDSINVELVMNIHEHSNQSKNELLKRLIGNQVAIFEFRVSPRSLEQTFINLLNSNNPNIDQQLNTGVSQ